MLVIKTSGIADNNLLATFYAMTGTYFEIVGSVLRKLFNSIFDLFGYSLEPTIPKITGPGSGSNGGILNKLLPDSSNLNKVIDQDYAKSLKESYVQKQDLEAILNSHGGKIVVHQFLSHHLIVVGAVSLI
jgi:hypothetical protein